MAYDVVWSFSAERDRDRIVEYLLYDLASPQAASHVLDELDKMIVILSDNPKLFALSAESRLARMGYRKYLFMRYVVLYRVEDRTVKVGRIFHTAQNYARLVLAGRFALYLMKFVITLGSTSRAGTWAVAFSSQAMFLPRTRMICRPSASCATSSAVLPWTMGQ